MKDTVLALFMFFSLSSFAQVNCYIYPEGSGERKACELCENSSEYAQGSRESQELFDAAIAVGPKFAWAYYQKSVPYFKRGFLLEGLEILNKAIELEPLEYLCYRAIWHWGYKNYELCIEDLERYYAMPKSYFQYTPGGEKNMRIILGLAYAKTGNYTKGIQTILDYLKTEDDVGMGDYHSLGIIYILNEQFDEAIIALLKQITINEDLADTYYFLGIAFKEKGNLVEAKKQFEMARIKFESGRRYFNPNAGFRVYPSDVTDQLKKLNQ